MSLTEYTEFEITVANHVKIFLKENLKYGSEARDQNKDTKITALFGWEYR